MKKIVVGTVIVIALIGAYIAGTYKPMHCSRIDLYDDGSFSCNGQTIAGHPRLPNVIKSEWYWFN